MNTKQETFLENLISEGVLKRKSVAKAFEEVKREDFIPEYLQSMAYEDTALPIGSGQTISQPYVVAFMLELLDPEPGEHILDVGAGSGWTTALIANIVGKNGKVIGVEIVPELLETGKGNLAKYPYEWAEIRKARETVVGLPDAGPFDKILVSAAGKEIPNALLNQLKIGGRMVVPVLNSIWKIGKISNSRLNKEEYPGFVFVPLIG